MTFSISIFLYIYIAFLVFWGLFFCAGLYHMLKFGFKNFTTFFAAFIFIAGALILLNISYIKIKPINWSQQITIFQGLFDKNETFFPTDSQQK